MSRRKGIQLCYPLEEKRLAKWEPPYICQPKLDGIRCRAVPYTGSVDSGHILLTSEENIIYHMQHIHLDLWNLPTHEYDGELYAHHLSFDEITSRTSRETNPHPDRTSIQYHIFDIKTSQFQGQRTLALKEIEIMHGSTDSIQFVPSYLANNFEQVLEYYQEFIEEGYEGIIVSISIDVLKQVG